MRIDWSTLALQTINALVLIWLLARFLFRPVAGIIAERQKAAQTLIADADAAKRAAVLERDTAARETQQLVA
ncbi:MAG: F0F1 ATP synthase subunit B, partial [Paraburkholderia sp.]